MPYPQTMFRPVNFRGIVVTKKPDPCLIKKDEDYDDWKNVMFPCIACEHKSYKLEDLVLWVEPGDMDEPIALLCEYHASVSITGE